MRIIIELYEELTDLATIRKGLHAIGKIDEDAPGKKILNKLRIPEGRMLSLKTGLKKL